MREPFRVTIAGIAGTLAVLALAALFVRLGIWQLDRLDERVARNETVAARMELPSFDLESFSGDTAGLHYRVAELTGEYDAAHGIVLAGRSYQSSPGVHLLVPVRLRDGSGILVQRGWIPALDASTVDPAAHSDAGPVQLRGILLPFPELGANLRSETTSADAGFRRLWYRLDGEGLRHRSPYPVAPLYLQLLPDETDAGYPLPLPPPDLDNGPHLGYALQWFSFAAIAMIGWLTLIIRRGGQIAGRGRVRAGDR
jgi:surfeit locus 1 family protein